MNLFANNRRRYLLMIFAGVVMLVVGWIGVDLSQLQAGLESPPDALVDLASDELALQSRPVPISNYGRFSVPVTDEIEVMVYARETETAVGNIFMIHGAGGGAWAWEAFFETVPETYNLYALSWRGHFDSTPVEDANSQDYVEDQLAVLAAIGERNELPIHVVGHSYGGATAVFMTAEVPDQVSSLTLLAPVVPLDYSWLQAQIVPRLLTPIIRSALDPEGGIDGPFEEMFLAETQMVHYNEQYASQPFSVEKPGLLAEDGFAVEWQSQLEAAYQQVGASGLPIWMQIARYDNTVVPQRQRDVASANEISFIQLESGHYIQLDVQNADSASMIVAHLNSLE